MCARACVRMCVCFDKLYLISKATLITRKFYDNVLSSLNINFEIFCNGSDCASVLWIYILVSKSTWITKEFYDNDPGLIIT